MRFKVVIPARLGSTRLPGKVLLDLAGKTLIQHVHDRAIESGAEAVWIATDSEQVAEVATGFSAQVHMTRSDHQSGTDRVAQVAEEQGWSDDTIVVNLQGDEPLMPSICIQQVADNLTASEAVDIATLKVPAENIAAVTDPNQVKVVCTEDDLALYFSRAPIPWDRQTGFRDPAAKLASPNWFIHMGLYAYRVGGLKKLTALPPSDLERLESLEQLRALANGLRIHVAEALATAGPGIDTEDDLREIRRLMTTIQGQ